MFYAASKIKYDRGQIELGVKRRGGKPGVEVKGLVAPRWGNVTADPNNDCRCKFSGFVL
jgi:hypothetical protein